MPESDDGSAEGPAQPGDDGDGRDERGIGTVARGGVDVVAGHPDVAGGERFAPVLFDVATALVEGVGDAFDLDRAAQLVAERDDAVETLHERYEPVPAHDARLARGDRPRNHRCRVVDAAFQLRQVERDALGREVVAAHPNFEAAVGCPELRDREPVVPGAPGEPVEHLHEGFVARGVLASSVVTGRKPAENAGDDRPPLRAIRRHELVVPALKEPAPHAVAVVRLRVPDAAKRGCWGAHGLTLGGRANCGATCAQLRQTIRGVVRTCLKQCLTPCQACALPELGTESAAPSYLASKKGSQIVGSFLRAPCRIRTDDPRFTRAVLWPTELRRRITSPIVTGATRRRA